ncbi:probable E3 ubiquitin-protein ligase HERC3 isoform X1 [Biomphalaria glabrata]|nr:probable E3 ubiquitin-protein ligase HERC3 isoform X1 [Biomphalaria glabrata]XP_055897506.1 probable E3 ubiquitin-protein ligase HERC3 isoform X1 [Biomphalaria glabrata]XP_055897514.1 probable E3 ubiquitin-protein ligase HERC3 isoform X1 [Biomphalaria glabrata]XP_055897521.1 probable E3 ubiquitin-protein ligase HERC3 isoform X1 [Biomphalaria glabrata]XP_055897525.1 probable E3 ubiquitin-protein ligase HERC3 isoform X1 [Biomphalaria glabrata]KAI8769580.1 ultraviolet-B receptor UVR8-like [Bio
MSLSLFGCGYNGFLKLSNIKLLDVESKSKVLQEATQTLKILSPLFLIQLKEKEDVHSIAITWARLGITMKRMNTFCSFITELSNNKYASQSGLQVFDNCIIKASTEQEILVKTPDVSKYLILKDNANESLHIDAVVETDLICGTHHAYFVSSNERFGELDPTKNRHQNEKVQTSVAVCPISSRFRIREMSCGKEHVLLLDDTGSIYSYGGGSKGQLGHSTVESKSLPTVIDALHGLTIKTISAGGWHSAAISVFGDLYMWGWNESGQLGLASLDKEETSSTIVTEPKCIYFSSDLNVVSVSCGSRHTVVLTGGGQVLASGWNRYGQLGLGDTINRWNFTQLASIPFITFQKVFAGHWNTIFLCQQSKL